MARSTTTLVADRAVCTFDRLARRLLYDYRLSGHAFEYPPREEDEVIEDHDPFEETIWGSIVTDQKSRVRPRYEAVGLLFRLPIGVFILACKSVWPFQAVPELSMVVAFCDHDGRADEYVLSRLVDPERRLGLGAWYEASVRFEAGGSGRWSHGFCARKEDPFRIRLDRMWRTHERRRADTLPRRQGDLLLNELWTHVLCKLHF